MRKMVNKHGEILNIREHIIIKNFWEYYITDHYDESSEIQEALVIGNEIEIGDVYLPELKPYVLVKTKQLNEIMPAIGYQWGSNWQ